MKALLAHCAQCTLFDRPFVPSTGSEDASVVVVGEAPGRTEVIKKEPFVGDSGKLLNAAVTLAGHKREELFLTNMVLCHPPDNREPTQVEIACCRDRLLNEIKAHPRARILALGKVASDSLLGVHREALRGSWGTLAGMDVIGTWHPAYVLRKPSEASGFLRDVGRAFRGPTITLARVQPEVKYVRSLEDLATVLSTAPDKAMTTYDLETNQTTWYDRPSARRNSIIMMATAWDSEMGVVVDDEMIYDEPGFVPLMQRFFEGRPSCGHNIKFDNVFLRSHNGLEIKTTFDTMLAHHQLDENSKHGLKELAHEELGVADYEKELISQYLNSKNDEYSKIPFEPFSQYAVWDVVCTLELQKIYESRLQAEGMLEWPFNRIIMPASEMFTRAELKGIKVDIPYLQQCGELMDKALLRIQYEAGTMVGMPNINLNSPAQVAVALWDVLKLTPSGSRKVKERSTSEEAITHLKGKHPFVDKLAYYRSVSKLKSSYVSNLITMADINGRVHPTFQLHGTEMGRISVKNPAMQTIPRPADREAYDYDMLMDGSMIRGAIIADPGNMIAQADFSQAELRVLAALSNESFLLQAYREGRDIHSKVALGMYGEHYTKEQRVKCKMFNFSYVYGGSEYSFAESAGLPVNIARQFVRDYNKLMPSALAYKALQLQLLKEQGFVTTRFGRKRRFPLITNDNLDDARKACVHAPIAGTASDLTMLSAIELSNEGLDIILLVHDSILAETPEPEDNAKAVAEHIAEVMQATGDKYLPEVTWKADPEVSYRWVQPPDLSQYEVSRF
jgi:uracil-DNA glycosylase family 4